MMKYKINTPTRVVSHDFALQLGRAVISWCEQRWAPQIKRRRKLLFVVHSDIDYVNLGSYDEVNNVITLNVRACRNVGHMIEVVIHEYIHFCQDLKEYAKETKAVGYKNNAFERKADAYAIRNYKKCWSEVRRELC